MKKATIFIIAFMVSFLTIYSIYYYKEIKKLDKSVVARAKDLPHTIIGSGDTAKTGFNIIYTQGLMQAIDSSKADSVMGQIPESHFAAFNTTYTRDHMEKYYENLVSKYPNHPPVEFDSVKEGNPVLLSYFFYNIRLPSGFRVSAKVVDFKGIKVRALQYHPSAADTGYVSFFKNDSSGQSAITVKINDGKEELVIFNSKTETPWKNALKEVKDFIADSTKIYHPKQDESALIPELDFNITKDEDLVKMSLTRYSLAQERVKFKISAPSRGGPLEVSEKFNTKENFLMNDHLLFFIREVNTKKPYCVISVNNPEILKLARPL